MLSREDQNKLSETELATAWREANGAARKLGRQLVLGERNPDPHPERNAPHPARSTVIRIIRPRPVSIAVEDIDQVRSHNDFVSSLGRSGSKFQ